MREVHAQKWRRARGGAFAAVYGVADDYLNAVPETLADSVFDASEQTTQQVDYL